MLSLSLSLSSRAGRGALARPGAVYLRPGGEDFYRRPDGTSGLQRPGAFAASTGAALAILIPAPHQVLQCSVEDKTADIVITGVYLGEAPASVQARWKGGAWTTIDAAPANGGFSGTLPAQDIGQGTLEVRYSNLPAVNSSVPLVGVGAVIYCMGQSNMSGRGTTPQTYFHATLQASCYKNDNTWGELLHPYDSPMGQVDGVSLDGAAGGSMIMLLATLLMEEWGMPVAFVPMAMGGTMISEWLPGADHLDRATLYGSAHYRAQQAGPALAALWWQGESDASASTTKATYKAQGATLSAAVMADMGVKMMMILPQDCTGIADAQETVIRNAIQELWAENANILTGADLSDLVSDDEAHLTTEIKLQTAADRTAAALFTSFPGFSP